MISALMLFVGCKPTKYVPSEKYLLNKVKVQIDTKNIKQQELKSYLRQKPNKRILGLRFHLGLYNLSNINKKKGINKYLHEIGEEPVIWDQFATNRSVTQLKLFLRKKGYYNAIVSDTLIFRKRKVDVFYHIQANKPYIIRSFKYAFEDTTIQRYILADTINSQIKVGKSLFDEFILDNERLRIESLMRNNGYYNFLGRELIDYNVDTSLMQVDLVMNVRNNVKLVNNQNVNIPYKQYKINQVVIRTETGGGFQQRGPLVASPKDTLLNNSIKFIYYENFWVKPNIIQQSNYIMPGALYKVSDVEETRSHLSSLNVFNAPNIKFTPLPSNDTSDYNYLDCQIQLSLLDSIQLYGWELDGTNSSGNLGGAVNLIYQHRSLFRNAENFNLKLRGATETVKRSESTQFFNTLEYGAEVTLKIPKFLLPFKSINFKKKYNPKTAFTITYNYQRRPEYTYTVANMSFGYQWKGGQYVSHIVNPMEVNFVNLPYTTAYFDSTYLENIYNNHLVSVTNYSYIFSNQNIKKEKDFHYFRWNMESAGNLLTLVNDLTGAKKTKVNDSTGYYELFGIRYSQYLRSDIEYRYYHFVNEGNKVVYRFFAGIGYPYGNATAIPFEKRYFSGGANSIRGWAVRKLGPGSYLDTISKYPNSTGDIKLEANLEYRFKLFWILEGAMFLDAGNIWTINRKDERPGVLFEWNKFYNDIAIGSGLGIRFNFNYFLFRVDLGLKTRNPAKDIGNRWIFNQGNLTSKDFAISLAIGYPF